MRVFTSLFLIAAPASLSALQLRSEQDERLAFASRCSLAEDTSNEIALSSGLGDAGGKRACDTAPRVVGGVGLPEVQYVSFVRRSERKGPFKAQGRFNSPFKDTRKTAEDAAKTAEDAAKTLKEIVRSAEDKAKQYAATLGFGDTKAPQAKTDKKLTVWVSGYPRSGSSTVLSMVSATVDDNKAGGHTFSLFEPCHDGDVYEKWLERQGCERLLYGISRCDFGGVDNLWGWRDPHSTSNYSKDFSATAAEDLCDEADVVAFKTVDYGHDLKKWLWLLDAHRNMKVLDVVRDPRAIYASWKTLEPFKQLVEAGDFYTLTEICNHFVKNLDLKDPRIHRVQFEKLMKSPEMVTRSAYAFMEQPFGEEQSAWLRNTFNAKDCPPPEPGMEGFTDCHTDGSDERPGQEKWRTVLSHEELAAFKHSEACQRVAEEYGYPQK